MHQIFLLQRETKNGTKAWKIIWMEWKLAFSAKMDDMKENMENMKNDLKADMEGLTKLIQEMFPNGEKIVEETHDEKRIILIVIS